MATAAQIAANRLNAQKSTGPRTPEGKSAARFNALKHGMDAATIVIPGEDSAAYDALAADYFQRFRPQSPIEEFHVDTLIRSDWQKRRLQRAEAKLYRALLAEGSTPEDFDADILRDSPTAKLLRKVFSQIASLDRAYFRALGDLRRLQRENDSALSPLDTMILEAACAPTAPAGLPITQAKVPELGSFPQNLPSPVRPPSSIIPRSAYDPGKRRRRHFTLPRSTELGCTMLCSRGSLPPTRDGLCPGQGQPARRGTVSFLYFPPLGMVG